jgi:predicted O-linked N-acetylglucosamine transferase (SPINDLY family)
LPDDTYAKLINAAWRGQLDFNTMLDRATQFESEKQAPLAAVLYQTWLKRNVSPYAHIACFNLGATLTNEGDLDGAEDAYRKAISLAPGFIHPRLNLGLLLERKGDIAGAVAAWRWVESNVPLSHAENRSMVLLAINHLGRVLEARKEYRSALESLTKSLHIDPNQPDVLHHWVYLRQKQCAWPIYAPVPGVSLSLMQKSTSALAMLNLSDDPAAQLAAAKRYVEKKLVTNVQKLSRAENYGHQRIRVGFLSSDFCLHPVSMLTVEMFECHDRTKFELFGYCWSPEDGSAIRQRVIASMDHFCRINVLTDEEAALKIRADEIDILVDLQGQTSGARANLLSYCPAPIQITYLGLPATTGLPSIDYVIADRFLIPEEAAKFYSEKPLYMPDVYQVSDRKRLAAVPPTRESCGLPDQGFVFCSFNNNFKYTPQIFDVWMRILKRVPGSVLWLLADNIWAQDNLSREAEVRGIDKNRLIFAGRVSPENYLARCSIADLFLDSFPFNAGTTANDALWMGLPVLTCSGRSFASRMAGALLTAAELPELISYSLDEYEEKAVDLAKNGERTRSMRAHLEEIRRSGALFDTPRFVRHLEAHYIRLVEGLSSPTNVQPSKELG